MATRWPFEALGDAIFTAMGNVVDLNANPVEVYDHTPVSGGYPRIVLGDYAAEFEELSELGGDVFVTVEVRVWSQYAGTKEINRILEQVNQRLSYQHALANDFSLLDEGQTQGVTVDEQEDATETSTRLATVNHLYRVRDERI